MGEDAMNFFTILSAYLVVAYFVGAKLSKFQGWAISFLSCIYGSGPIVATYISVADLWSLSNHAPHPATTYFWMLPGARVAAWFVSLGFMINARRNPRA
jgi:hypothetical protein